MIGGDLDNGARVRTHPDQRLSVVMCARAQHRVMWIDYERLLHVSLRLAGLAQFDIGRALRYFWLAMSRTLTQQI
jgi:hypothetical protein